MQGVVLFMFSMLPGKRDLKISTTGGGTPKRRERERDIYIYTHLLRGAICVPFFVHLLTFGHILNQSCC